MSVGKCSFFFFTILKIRSSAEGDTPSDDCSPSLLSSSNANSPFQWNLFEVKLSSDTDTRDIKEGMHNAGRDGRMKRFKMCRVGLFRDESSDLQEGTFFF